jgi:hypothetical protein
MAVNLDSIAVRQHAVPEQASVALPGLGLLGVVAGRRKRSARKTA